MDCKAVEQIAATSQFLITSWSKASLIQRYVWLFCFWWEAPSKIWSQSVCLYVAFCVPKFWTLVAWHHVSLDLRLGPTLKSWHTKYKSEKVIFQEITIVVGMRNNVRVDGWPRLRLSLDVAVDWTVVRWMLWVFMVTIGTNYPFAAMSLWRFDNEIPSTRFWSAVLGFPRTIQSQWGITLSRYS